MSKLIWEKLIQWDKNLKEVTITESGKKFIQKQIRKNKINEFNYYTSFIKNIAWIIAFIFSILANIFYSLKYYGII